MVQHINVCSTFCTQISSLCIPGEESKRFLILFRMLDTKRSQAVNNLSKGVGNRSLFCLQGSFLSIILNNKKVVCNSNPSEDRWKLIEKKAQKKQNQDFPLFLGHFWRNSSSLFNLEMEVQEKR